MKKLFFTALVAIGLISAQAAYAQVSLEDLPPYKLGIAAGLNASSFSHDGFDGKCGFHIGVDALFDASALIENTYVRTDLLFQRKGARIGDDWKSRTCYLEFPVRYGYAEGINNDVTIFGETGPYLAFGLGGRTRIDVIDVETDKKVTLSEKFFTGKNDANLFDFGWGLHMGVIYKQDHQLGVGWDWGLINMNDNCLQNRNFMVSYTYFFL